MAKAGGISIHGVDIARGIAAEGLQLALDRLTPAGGRIKVASGALAADGTLKHPVVTGEGVEAAAHEVVFALGDWFRANGYATRECSFLDVVPFRFVITDVSQHYHLPFKFTPWGIQLFRGV
jgi:5-hydroxyisourate hydrolase